jgi:hypothetical protein
MLLIKNPEALFNLDTDSLSFATVHNRHLKPTFNVDEEDGKSEGPVPTVDPSPATPPCRNPNKEAMRTKESLSATSFPPSEEVVGDKRAVDGG